MIQESEPAPIERTPKHRAETNPGDPSLPQGFEIPGLVDEADPRYDAIDPKHVGIRAESPFSAAREGRRIQGLAQEAASNKVPVEQAYDDSTAVAVNVNVANHSDAVAQLTASALAEATGASELMRHGVPEQDQVIGYVPEKYEDPGLDKLEPRR